MSVSMTVPMPRQSTRRRKTRSQTGRRATASAPAALAAEISVAPRGVRLSSVSYFTMAVAVLSLIIFLAWQ
jgi:hypothetical protein